MQKSQTYTSAVPIILFTEFVTSKCDIRIMHRDLVSNTTPPSKACPTRQSSWVLSLISLSGPKQRWGCSQQWAMWAPSIKQVPCHPCTNCRPSNAQQVQRMRATHIHGSESYVIWEHCKIIHIFILERWAVTVCPITKSKLICSWHPLASPWLTWNLSLCKSNQKSNAYSI